MTVLPKLQQYYWIKLKDSKRFAPVWTVAMRVRSKSTIDAKDCWAIVGTKEPMYDTGVDTVGSIVPAPGPISVQELVDGQQLAKELVDGSFLAWINQMSTEGVK